MGWMKRNVLWQPTFGFYHQNFPLFLTESYLFENYYPSFPKFLTYHCCKASLRSHLCLCGMSLSLAAPLYSQTLHSIHLCLSTASTQSPHPSFLLLYSYPMSFPYASRCCMSWQPSSPWTCAIKHTLFWNTRGEYIFYKNVPLMFTVNMMLILSIYKDKVK